MAYMFKEGIQCVGTVRINRVKENSLLQKNAFAKLHRGSIQERESMVDGVKIYLNQWNDNRVVSTLSNFVGAAPEEEVRRFQRKTKTYINIKRPKCIELYN